MTAESATYLYCVVKGERAPSLAKAPRGLPGAGKPRVVVAEGGYRLVVASVPLAKYSAEAIEPRLRDIDWVSSCAGAHEDVVEHVAKSGTVVPAKLFTMFASDERAVAHVMRSKKVLDRVVSRIAGCDEWGLRILFDEARAAKVKRARARAQASREQATGTSFLLRKKAEEDAKRTLATEARGEVDDLFARLSKRAKRALRRPPPSRELAGRVLLDAVFLVEKTGTKAFTSLVASSAEGLADEGYHVTLTGPWPAYSFIEAR
jgi:hypothetical protein